MFKQNRGLEMNDSRKELSIPVEEYNILMERYVMNDVKKTKAAVERDEALDEAEEKGVINSLMNIAVNELTKKLMETRQKLVKEQQEMSKVHLAMNAIGIQLIHLPNGDIAIVK